MTDQDLKPIQDQDQDQDQKPPLTRDQLREMTHDQIIAYDPDRYKLARNGVIQDAARNKIIVKGQENPNFTDPEKRRDAHERRRELAREAARDGMQAATAQTTPAAAWKEIIKARTLAALDPGNTQGNAAARLVGEAAGIFTADKDQDRRPGITINIDADTASRLLDAIAARTSRQP